VHLTVDGIDNPRAADNLSGTLSLELWALPPPTPAASPTACSSPPPARQPGRPAGWHTSRRPAAGRPPAGTWHVALLLREWTAAGYVTRDFANFRCPSAGPPKPPGCRSRACPRQAGQEAARRRPLRKPPQGRSRQGLDQHRQRSRARRRQGPAKTVAAAIVAARPFKQVDELLKVKGLGAKLLDKLKGSLAL
jgi:hypothetical protein